MTTTESFFWVDLPAAIVRDLERFRHLHGTLAFSCAGRKFTVTLGDLHAPVIAGFLRTADVKLWFFADAFERFLAAEAIAPRSVRLEGSAEVLERFGRFLQPSASPLSIRLAA